MSPDTVRSRIRYAQAHHSVLKDHKVDSILTLASDKRNQVLKSLSSLAKFTGQYKEFMQLRGRYNLTWSNEHQQNTDVLQKFFVDDSDD
jgi:hypothetical protein